MPTCEFIIAANMLAGGLIVLSLFLRRWSVSQCVKVFDTLTQEFFQRAQKNGRNPFGFLRHVINCWLSDGCYDVVALEEALKQSFGHDSRMFDTPGALSGTKVAVTATNISDASPFIFSNYNGVTQRAANCGKTTSR